LIDFLLTAENAEHAESLWFVVHRKISQRLPILTEFFWVDGSGDLGVELVEQLWRGNILGFVVSVWYFVEKLGMDFTSFCGKKKNT
jgi:hypothetical protein